MGEVGIIDTDEPVILGQRLTMFRANRELANPHFLLFSLLSTRVQDQLNLLSAGSLHPHLRV